jgi:anti-sigma-K factor RskA
VQSIARTEKRAGALWGEKWARRVMKVIVCAVVAVAAIGCGVFLLAVATQTRSAGKIRPY